MGKRHLVGSNTLIDFLSGRLPPDGKRLMFDLIDQDEVNISVITEIEVLGFQAPEEYLQKVQRLVDEANVIPLAEPAIVQKAIEIRRHSRLKLPDAVIAATALTRQLTLITRNEKDFSRVEDLKILNPHSL
ncbi:MAG: type II toxin-antitoxin system VapC family toxin [Cytophagaceae bacterium]|nr:type II toxin-antitoxin system VapC family toxin [Cytophagaceae bacterium]